MNSMANQIELKRKRIGVLEYRTSFYTYLRTIMNKLPEAEYVPVRDLFSLRTPSAMINRMIGKPLIPTLTSTINLKILTLRVIYHLMNGVVMARPLVVCLKQSCRALRSLSPAIRG